MSTCAWAWCMRVWGPCERARVGTLQASGHEDPANEHAWGPGVTCVHGPSACVHGPSVCVDPLGMDTGMCGSSRHGHGHGRGSSGHGHGHGRAWIQRAWARARACGDPASMTAWCVRACGPCECVRTWIHWARACGNLASTTSSSSHVPVSI